MNTPGGQNKGVTTNLDSDSDSSKIDVPKRSISLVKRDLEAVIELMGPDTPHFNQTATSDLEHEETYSIMSRVDDKDSSFTADDSYNKTTCTETLPRDDRASALAEPATSCTNCSFVSVQYHPSTYCPEGCTCGYLNNYKVCPRPKLPLQTRTICPMHTRSVVSKFSQIHIKGSPRKSKQKKMKAYTWIKNALKKGRHEREESLTSDYYKINVKQSTMDRLPPKKLVFELVDRNLKRRKPQEPVVIKCDNPECKTISPVKTKDMKNMNNEKMVLKEVHYNNNPDLSRIIQETSNNNEDLRKTTIFDFEGSTRVDVYYFDHGDAKYLQTVDKFPLASTELMAERTEEYTAKFWAEIFGTIHIGFSFCTSFVLQFFRFVSIGIVKPMTVGVLQIVSDYLLKPFLATAFNALIQPPLIFTYNITMSIRDLLQPLAEGMGYFIREWAVMFKSIRLVDIKKNKICDGEKCNDT